MGNNVYEVCKKYAEELVKIKLFKRVAKGCLMLALLLIAGPIVAYNITKIGLILPLVIVGLGPLAIGVFSALKVNFLYDEVVKDKMTRKEFKELFKKGEIQKNLRDILSNNQTSGVQQIDNLANVLNGKNPNYKKPLPIVESIRKEVYGQDAKQQKKNSMKR